MRLIKLATTLFVSGAAITPIHKDATRINEIFIEPLTSHDDTVIAIKATIGRTSKINVVGKIYNDKYKTGVQLFSDSIVKTGTHFFNYDNSFNYADNNEIEITTTIGEKSTVYRHYINVSRPTYEFLNDEKIMVASYDSYIWNSSWSYGKQEYRFINFDDLYMPNFYQKIDISNFKVKVTGVGSSYFKTSGTFIFNNVDGLFQGLCEENFTNIVRIPVSFEKESENLYYLKFDIDLFVNKQTLEMSREKKQNYLQTKYIYLPRNNMRIQEEIECSLSFDKFGIDKDNFSHSFTLKALINVMGDCHNSEYCVIKKYD